MGFLGLGKKKEDAPEEAREAAASRAPEGELFNEACGLCGKQPTETKWMGQYWHRVCKRKAKRMAKGMMR